MTCCHKAQYWSTKGKSLAEVQAPGPLEYGPSIKKSFYDYDPEFQKILEKRDIDLNRKCEPNCRELNSPK